MKDEFPQFRRVRHMVIVHNISHGRGWNELFGSTTIFFRTQTGTKGYGYTYGRNDPNIQAYITPLGQRLEGE